MHWQWRSKKGLASKYQGKCSGNEEAETMKHLGTLARLRLHKVRVLLEVVPQDLVPRRSLMEPFGDRNRMAGDPQVPRRSRWSLSLAGVWTFSVALLLRRRSKLQGWRVVTVETQGLDLEKKFCWSKKMCCHSASTIKADWALPAVSRNRIVKVTLEKKS